MGVDRSTQPTFGGNSGITITLEALSATRAGNPLPRGVNQVIPLAPHRFFLSAPQRPLRLMVAVAIGIAAIAFVASATNAGGFMPGIADSKADGAQVTLSFDVGDRFFWLPLGPAATVYASDLLEAIPGEQAVTKRANFQASTRSAYEEGRGDKDLLIEADFLYEISGVNEEAVFTYQANLQDGGRNFFQDIHDNSNTVFKRIWLQIQAIPGIIASDIAQFGDDVHDLIHGDDEFGGASKVVGSPHGFWERVRDNWVVFAGLAAIVFAGPLFGFGPTFTGASGAAILFAGGFYALAGLCLAIGVLSDPNLPIASAIGVGGGTMGDRFADWRRSNAQLWAGVGIFLIGAAVSGILGWFGHPNLVAIAVTITGLVAAFVLSTRAFVRERDENEDFYEEHVDLTRVSLGPAFGLAALGFGNFWWLKTLGYDSFAMGFMILCTVMALITFSRWVKTSEAVAERWGAEHAWAKRQVGSAKGIYRVAVGNLHAGSRLSLWLAFVFLWLAVADVAVGDWLAASVNVLLATVVVVGVYVFQAIKFRKQVDEATPT